LRVVRERGDPELLAAWMRRFHRLAAVVKGADDA
jgi:hypothetical protein